MKIAWILIGLFILILGGSLTSCYIMTDEYYAYGLTDGSEDFARRLNARLGSGPGDAGSGSRQIRGPVISIDRNREIEICDKTRWMIMLGFNRRCHFFRTELDLSDRATTGKLAEYLSLLCKNRVGEMCQARRFFFSGKSGEQEILIKMRVGDENNAYEITTR